MYAFEPYCKSDRWIFMQNYALTPDGWERVHPHLFMRAGLVEAIHVAVWVALNSSVVTRDAWVPSAWIESVITFLEANFHCFSRIQGAENIETCPEPLRTFPNVISGCQQSFRTVRNTPMGVDRQNPSDLDFRQNRCPHTLVSIGDPCSRGAREFRQLYTLKGQAHFAVSSQYFFS